MNKPSPAPSRRLFGLVVSVAPLALVQGLVSVFGHHWLPGGKLETVRAGLAMAWAALALFWLVRFAWLLRPRWITLPLAILAGYVAVETIVGPWLIRPLKMPHYSIVRDPDHRPVDLEARVVPTRPESFHIVFLGDSYTEGFRLSNPSKQAFPALVANKLRARYPKRDVRVSNLGWLSCSPLLGARLLDEIGSGLGADLVVYCVDMTDFHDDIKYTNLLERRGITAFYDRLPIAITLLKRSSKERFRALYDWSTGDSLPRDRYFHSGRPLAQSRPFLGPVAASLRRLGAQCHALRADFVVCVLPRYYQYSDTECPFDWENNRRLVSNPHRHAPFQFFAELATEVEFPIHSLLDDFAESLLKPHCFPGDPHWNELGHRIAATAIERRLAPRLEQRLRVRGTR